MAGEAQVADLPLLERLEPGVDRAFLVEDPVRVVVVAHLVELPEVEVVGPQPPEAVFEAALRVLGGSARSTWSSRKTLSRNFPSARGLAHPFLGQAVVIIPGVVEEGDPFVDRPLDQLETGSLIKDGGGWRRSSRPGRSG